MKSMRRALHWCLTFVFSVNFFIRFYFSLLYSFNRVTDSSFVFYLNNYFFRIHFSHFFCFFVYFCYCLQSCDPRTFSCNRWNLFPVLNSIMVRISQSVSFRLCFQSGRFFHQVRRSLSGFLSAFLLSHYEWK